MCEVTDLPACAFYFIKPDPAELVICRHEAVRTARSIGALVRNKRTGIYCIYCCGCFSSVDQRWAQSVDHGEKDS